MDCEEVLERIMAILDEVEIERVNPRCERGRLVVDDVQLLVERLLREIDELVDEIEEGDLYYDEEEYDLYEEDEE